MEKTDDLSFLTALWPFTGVIFLIVLGVLLLNHQFNKKIYRQQLEQEKLKASHRFELLQESISVQETERKRIARDMHDELGATLSMARMHLVQISQAVNDSSLAARIDNVRHITERALASMRRISHALMPPQLESFGLLQTLEDIVAQINEAGELRITLDAPEDFPRLPLATELGIYRTGMELVNNTIRHAQAQNVHILFEQNETGIRFEYRDDGKGLPEGGGKTGIGRKSMETRVQALGGTFTMVNTEPKGICAIIELPPDGTKNKMK